VKRAVLVRRVSCAIEESDLYLFTFTLSKQSVSVYAGSSSLTVVDLCSDVTTSATTLTYLLRNKPMIVVARTFYLLTYLLTQ